MGLEPTTFSLATRRSTTELCPLIVNDYRYLFFKIQSLLKFKFYHFSIYLDHLENSYNLNNYH